MMQRTIVFQQQIHRILFFGVGRVVVVISNILLLLVLLSFDPTIIIHAEQQQQQQQQQQQHGDATTTLQQQQHIVIAIAMEAEAQPFIEQYQLQPVDGFFPSNTPFHAYSDSIHTSSSSDNRTPHIIVVTNGNDNVYGTGVDNVSTVPSALVIYLTLKKLTTRTNDNNTNNNKIIVITAGTCGGFQRKGAAIGDVYIVNNVVYHDRRIPIPVFTPYGVGHLQSTVSYLDDLALTNNYKIGTCTTGNSLDTSTTDQEQILANDATVKDMEAAAVAWSVQLFAQQPPPDNNNNNNIQWFGVKVVTDIVDGNVPTADEFLKNLHTASTKLQQSLPQIVQYITSTNQRESSKQQQQQQQQQLEEDVDNDEL